MIVVCAVLLALRSGIWTTAYPRTTTTSSSSAGAPTTTATSRRTVRRARARSMHLLEDAGRARDARPSMGSVGGTPPGTAARLGAAHDVRRRQVVPSARLTDLDHVDRELGVLRGQRRQLAGALDPPAVDAELVAVDVGHVGEPLLAAHRARRRGRLAVVLGGPQQ